MWKWKYNWKHFRTIRANQFLILVNIYYCYKVFNIYSFWLKTVFNNYGSDFDILISIISILMTYTKNPNECTFFEIVSILIYFQAIKFLKLPRHSTIFKLYEILSFSWNWQPQKTFVCKVSTFLHNHNFDPFFAP